MGFFSEDGNKSIMRLIVFVISICGCIIVMGTFIVWAIFMIHNLSKDYPLTDRVDITQPAQLGCWLIGLALTGKTLQKSVEFAKNIKNKHFNIDVKDKQNGMLK